VPFSPLGYGFLTGAIDMQTSFAPGDFRSLTPRMDPDNRRHNMALVELVRAWSARKQVAPGQVALAWLMAQKPWIVPIPGTTQMAHMHENVTAASVRFTEAELTELNRAVAAVQVRGARLPAMVQAWSGVEARARS
jgi:aryl-alcohol dehydrogenase-like predicted oxidoreductase